MHKDVGLMSPDENLAFKGIATALRNGFVDADLYAFASKMLLKESSGGAGAVLFEKTGSTLRSDFRMAAGYYPYHSDLDLILRHSGYYAELAQQNRTKAGPLVVVELGAGGAKTEAFLKAVEPDIFVPVDHAITQITDVADMVRKKFPNVQIKPRLRDFNKDDLDLRELNAGRVIVAQFGCPLGNKAGFPQDPFPISSFAADIDKYGHILNDEDDRLIVSVDHNHDKKSLDACYDGEGHEELAMRLLERIRDELPISNDFDPKNFKYHSEWFPQSHLYAIGYRSLKDQSFKIGGRRAEWAQGETMFHTNSYRFTDPLIDQITAQTRLRKEGTKADNQGRIHQHEWALRQL